MSEETTINGIDVSECKFYNGCECDAYRHEYWEPQDNTKDMCKEHDNCYFKQLARLQEENEKLKGRNANLRLNLATYDLPEIKKVLTDWRTGELDKKFKKLQKENEKLKERLSDAEAIIMTYKIEKEQYKQALEEIREMTSVNAINTCWEILNTCDDCKSKKDCGIQSPITKLKFIENKIDEALNDRD